MENQPKPSVSLTPLQVCAALRSTRFAPISGITARLSRQYHQQSEIEESAPLSPMEVCAALRLQTALEAGSVNTALSERISQRFIQGISWANKI